MTVTEADVARYAGRLGALINATDLALDDPSTDRQVIAETLLSEMRRVASALCRMARHTWCPLCERPGELFIHQPGTTPGA